MKELKSNIKQTINIIEEIADHFYKQQDKQAYDKIYQFIPEVSKTIEQIIMYKTNNTDVNIDENRIINTLKEAMTAMEDKDTVLLADILQYEFAEQFKEIIDIV